MATMLKGAAHSAFQCRGLHAPRRVGLLPPARADGPRVTREYREDENGNLTELPPNGALYADEAPQARAPKRKDNMSKEMKQKLRQEYMGLGGAENTVLLPRRAPIIAAVSVEEREAPAPSPSGQQPSSSTKVRSSKWKIDENEQLASTTEHRAWTFGSMGLMAATLAQGLAALHSPGEWVFAGLALAVSYVLSDLGTGVYHWGVDNYGDGKTPFFGRQIAAFQGHHQRPWTITEREFCNNVHQVFKPAAVPAALFLLLSPLAAPSFNIFISSFIFLVCMSQQFHAWSHMKKSELPGPVVALQDAGVLISRKMHGAHHRAPFEGNYCIVSGLWNPLLDSTEAFRHLERAIHASTGVEPRCWHEPEYDWAEQERPVQA